MPGIAGIIARGAVTDNSPVLRRMLNCMLHEPHYTSGIYVNEGIGLFAGWVNRAGSFSDCMPLWNETNDICLIYYGENFPEKGLTDSLKARGHVFDASDASYLVHLFEEEGGDFPGHLNGWFNGVLVDLRRGEVILFNDRYGMQRIYYHEREDALYFSSEAKALLGICPELRELDMRGVGELFSFGCVLENRTLFSDVFLLPPGSVWTYRAEKGLRKESHFIPAIWENQLPLEKEEFYREFKETFVNILPRYLDGKEKQALSLTGGLDTRMILACMTVPPGELPCYTFGGMYRDSFDVRISRKIAQACQQTHKVLALDRNFFDEFPQLAEKTVYVTDGCLNVSGSVELYVNRLAREIAPVRVTGNYGSEILRGARNLKASPACRGLFDGEFEKHIDGAAVTLSENYRRASRISFAAFKQAPWYQYNRLALEQSQLTLRSPYLDNDLVGLMYRAPAEVLDSSDLSLRLINDGNPELARIATDRGVGGNHGFLLSRVARLYREFLFKGDYAFDYGMPQWLAKMDCCLLAPLHVERLFLGRHKFYHFRVWFRDELSGYVKEILLDPKSLRRPYLNGRFVERMVLDHTSGRLNYTQEISSLLTVELLQRLMIDSQPEEPQA